MSIICMSLFVINTPDWITVLYHGINVSIQKNSSINANQYTTRWYCFASAYCYAVILQHQKITAKHYYKVYFRPNGNVLNSLNAWISITLHLLHCCLIFEIVFPADKWLGTEKPICHKVKFSLYLTTVSYFWYWWSAVFLKLAIWQLIAKQTGWNNP